VKHVLWQEGYVKWEVKEIEDIREVGIWEVISEEEHDDSVAAAVAKNDI
jgi:hypothetical protein